MGKRKTSPTKKSSQMKQDNVGKGSALPTKVLQVKLEKCDKLTLQNEEGGDSDYDASTTSASSSEPEKQPRKRSQKPKSTTNKDKQPPSKKLRQEQSRVPFGRPPVGQLKKNGKSFLQKGCELPQNDSSSDSNNNSASPSESDFTTPNESYSTTPNESDSTTPNESDSTTSTAVSEGATGKELRRLRQRTRSSKYCECKNKSGKGPPHVYLGKPSVARLLERGESSSQNRILRSRNCYESPQSESCSDWKQETDSTKDNDSSASTTVSESETGNEPRKKGHRSNNSKNGKREEQRAEKLEKNPPGMIDKSFLQDGPCSEAAPTLGKCRECKQMPDQDSRNTANIFCRFYSFRRLRYTKQGRLASAGFSSPDIDALDNRKLWLPDTDNPPSDLDMETSRFLLLQVGDNFCDLLVQEKEAHERYISDDKTVAWKRIIDGVREMCDVCATTIFNYHWACHKCGFVVCLDCNTNYKKDTTEGLSNVGKERDKITWLRCLNRASHKPQKLLLAQIIPNDCLLKLGKMVHEMRDLWFIEQCCGCPDSKKYTVNNAECREAVKRIIIEKFNEAKKEEPEPFDPLFPGLTLLKYDNQSPLNVLADVALSQSVTKIESEESSSSEEEEDDEFSLRKLLYRPIASTVPKEDKKETESENIDYDPSWFEMKNYRVKQENGLQNEKNELKHFIRRYNWQNMGWQQAPIRIMTLTVSKRLYPKIPHSWLCNGKVLRLLDPVCEDNNIIFQEQWKRGQPVIVSDVSRLLDKDLWTPEAFSRDFGEEKNDLVNCMSGKTVPNQPMRKFWEGFENPSKRLKDACGLPMLLKLKDWPPGEDFAKLLPSRFQDLMEALPLPEYTRRSGKLNLASRLPDCFVRPDLGPKMYNAYGTASNSSKGTTNLHLDVSDAVNVMVYVGVTQDDHIKEAMQAIEEAGCDFLTLRRVRQQGELPGALWHIYNARDADKIRDLLNKVTKERGGQLEPHTDPIHDQSCYLDARLRERLYLEYGIEGYAILQCQGDAVFIPAGAPHQVRNINNCIKVAEDFVSPENVGHCFHLTQEFRALSKYHSNHEDKLQIKNIIYCTVKDAVSTLGSLVNKKLGRRVVAVDTPYYEDNPDTLANDNYELLEAQ